MMYRCAALIAFVVVASTSGHAQSAPTPDVRGAWRAELYELETGERHAVKGLIVFTASDWSVTLFFTPEGSAPHRAVAEGGTYTLDGSAMSMKHLFRFSAGSALPGLPASPLRMEVDRTEAALEPIVVTVQIERLTLSFPSGNTMTFRRSSRF